MIGKRMLLRLVPVIALAGAMLAGTVGTAGAATSGASRQVAATPANAPAHRIDTLAAAEAYVKAHPATRAQIAAVEAYLRAHPIHLQATLLKMPAPSRVTSKGGVSPNVSVSVYWYGVEVFLTPADTEAIWNSIIIGGLSGAGAALCAGGGPVAVIACGVVGGIIGYLIADAVYNWFDWGRCGLDFWYNWANGPGYGVRYWDCH